MILDDATYFTRRALWQMDRASQAFDEVVAEVHIRLSAHHLHRALSHIEEAFMEEAANVTPLRIVS